MLSILKHKIFISLRTKLIFLIFLPITIMFLVVFAYLANTMHTSALNIAKELAVNKSSEGAGQVKSYFESALASAQTLANAYNEWKENGNGERKMVDLMMKRVLATSDHFLAVWTQFEFTQEQVDGFEDFTIEKSIDVFGNSWLRSGNEIVQDYVASDYESYYEPDFYQLPKKTLRSLVVEPYLYIYPGDKTQKEYYETSCVFPLIANNMFFGVVGIDLDLSVLHAVTDKMNKYQNGTSGIVSSNFTIAMHTDTALISRPMHRILQTDSAKLSRMLKSQSNILISTYNDSLDSEILYAITPISIGKTGVTWYYFISVHLDDVRKEVNNKLMFDIALGAVALIAVLFILFFISQQITEPINNSVDFAKQMSEGLLVHNLQTTNNDETRILADSLNTMSDKLTGIINTIKNSSSKYKVASAEILNIASLTSESSSKQAASIEETTASMEEMVASLNQIADNAMYNQTVVNESHENIVLLSDSIHQTLESLKTIVEKIHIIDEITGKTQILAINASIESARAGELGKGFAVVANEVRGLSEQSKKAAAIIHVLSTESITNAEKTKQLIESTLQRSQTSAQLVHEIATSSSVQREGINQINHLMSEMNQITQTTASLAENMALKSKELADMANELLTVVAFFKTEVKTENKYTELHSRIVSIERKLNNLNS